MLTELGWAAAVAVVSMLGSLLQGRIQFHESACSRFDPFMNRYLVGQESSLRVVTDALCDFLDPHVVRMDGHSRQGRPLVLSIHGPPGVGKTYFHQLAAHVLYGVHTLDDDDDDSNTTTHKVGARGISRVFAQRHGVTCPGHSCPGYHVLFGMDYTSHDREVQHGLLQKALLDQVSQYPQSLIVIEEYDKLDCYMRGFFRHILQGGMVGNQSLGQAIIVLESNLGYSVLHRMLEEKGGRDMIDMQEAQRALKDMVFQVWQQQGCEDFSDSQKLLRSIDFFLPFYPLEKKHLEILFRKTLNGFQASAWKEFGTGNVTLEYGLDIVEFLIDKVEFDGKYPIEGGKEVHTVSTGYLSRPYRVWVNELKQKDGSRNGIYSWVHSKSGRSLEIVRNDSIIS